MSTPRAHVGRICLVWLAVVAPTTLGAFAALSGVRRSTPWASLSFDELLVRACGLVLVGLGLWFTAVTTLVCLRLLAERGDERVRGCPEGLRRLLLAACGVALTGSLALPAHAATLFTGEQPAPASVLSGLPLPDRVGGHPIRAGGATASDHRTELGADSASPDSTPGVGGDSAAEGGDSSTPGLLPVALKTAGTPGATTSVHRVTVGESLWQIAADRLPPGANTAAIDSYWREIYAANRETIGSDPDLIVPGQRLVLPRVSALDR